METKTLIEKFQPCRAGVEFLKKFGTLDQAWAACERGDWMLWLAEHLKIDNRILVGCAGKCASTVKHLMEDPRSLAALEACEKYATGEIGKETLADAAYAAYAAADAAAYAARKANRKQTADICREMLTVVVLRQADK